MIKLKSINLLYGVGYLEISRHFDNDDPCFFYKQ